MTSFVSFANSDFCILSKTWLLCYNKKNIFSQGIKKFCENIILW